MGLEAILSEVKIRDDKLFLSFRGLDGGSLGSVYCDWMHKFPTKILGRNDGSAQKFVDSLKKTDLGKYDISAISNVFEIAQIEAPLKERHNLPKDFVHQHYTQYARWNFGFQASLVEIDDEVYRMLKEKSHIDSKLYQLKETLDETLSNLTQQTRTGRWNKLVKHIHDGDSVNSKLYSNEIFRKVDYISEIISEFEEKNKLNLEYDKKHSSLKLNLDSHAYFDWKRPLNAQDLLKQKWAFIDIEVPRFIENDEISWVGLNFYQDGFTEKEIHTLRSSAPKNIKGYDVIKHETQEELIHGVRNSINNQDPYIVSAFNANFDLIKMREGGESKADFKVGERNSDPKKEVSQKFWERIGIYGREVVDLFRWAKKRFRYLPNQKLEMVGKELGFKFEKSISYAEMHDHEENAIAGSKDDAKIIASYLADDMDVMPDIINTKAFKDDLEDYCWLSDKYHVSLPRLIHSSNSLNESQEKSYFEHVGTFRDVIYLKTKFAIGMETKAKERFKKHLEDLVDSKTSPGIYDNVSKIYIPYGFFLGSLVSNRFPELNDLGNKVNSLKDDSNRQFNLHQDLNAFAKYMIVDFGIYKLEQDKLNKLLKKIGKRDTNISYFARKFKGALDSDEEISFWKGKLRGDVARKTIEGNYKLNNFVKEVIDHISHDTRVKDVEKTAEDLFVDAILQFSKVDNKSRKFYGNYATGITDFETLLEDKVNRVNKYFVENNAEVVHKNGPWVYITGYTGEKEPIDNLSRIILSRDKDKMKLYYEKNGFYEGIKIKDDPSNNLCVYEMDTYGDFIKNVLDDKPFVAMSDLYTALDCLTSRKIDAKDMVMKSKGGRYRTFDERLEDNMYFFTDEYYSEGKKVHEDEIGSYVVENIHRKDRNVYHLSLDDIHFDHERFERRVLDKVQDLLYSTIGVTAGSKFLSKCKKDSKILYDEEIAEYASLIKSKNEFKLQ